MVALHYAPGSIKPNFADTNNDTASLIYTDAGASFSMGTMVLTPPVWHSCRR